LCVFERPFANFVTLYPVVKGNGWFRIPRPALSIPLMMKKVALFYLFCIFEVFKDLTAKFVNVVNW